MKSLLKLVWAAAPPVATSGHILCAIWRPNIDTHTAFHLINLISVLRTTKKRDFSVDCLSHNSSIHYICICIRSTEVQHKNYATARLSPNDPSEFLYILNMLTSEKGKHHIASQWWCGSKHERAHPSLAPNYINVSGHIVMFFFLFGVYNKIFGGLMFVFYFIFFFCLNIYHACLNSASARAH